MNNRFIRYLQFSLILLDLLSINLVFYITLFVFSQEKLPAPFENYRHLGIFINMAWYLAAIFTNVYLAKNIRSLKLFTKKTAYNYFYALIGVSFYILLVPNFNVSGQFLIVVLTAIPAILLLNRFLYLVIYRYFKKKENLISKVVVIGYNDFSKKIVDFLEADGINKEILGYCEESQNVRELSRYPILSNIKSAIEVCKTYGANEIYSTIVPEQHPDIYQLIQMADENCIRFKIVPDISQFINRKVQVDFLNGMPVISLRREPLEDLANRIKKRVFDLVVSSLVIVFFLSWMIPVIGLLIWLESRGPVFFLQARSGRDNKSFLCMKFRSMQVNNKSNELQATKNDKRVTRSGRFLRSTSLDEFPQFLNVFLGSMSIVGPRPHMLKHTDQYSGLIRQYMVRQFLKPGITGWAQVNGFRGETKVVEQMQHRVEHDLWYMENWSSSLDLKIMFLTVFNGIKGEKMAY